MVGERHAMCESAFTQATSSVTGNQSSINHHIIIIRYELGLNTPVLASSNSLFKGLPSHLLPSDLRILPIRTL